MLLKVLLQKMIMIASINVSGLAIQLSKIPQYAAGVLIEFLAIIPKLLGDVAIIFRPIMPKHHATVVHHWQVENLKVVVAFLPARTHLRRKFIMDALIAQYLKTQRLPMGA